MPKHKHRQSVQSDSGVFLRQEGKQESPVVRGEPLLRNKSALGKNRGLQGEEHFRKKLSLISSERWKELFYTWRKKKKLLTRTFREQKWTLRS